MLKFPPDAADVHKIVNLAYADHWEARFVGTTSTAQPLKGADAGFSKTAAPVCASPLWSRPKTITVIGHESPITFSATTSRSIGYPLTRGNFAAWPGNPP